MVAKLRIRDVQKLIENLYAVDEYRGCFVAIDLREAKIVDMDRDLENLLKKIRSRGIDESMIIVEYIPREPVELVV